MNPLIQYLVLLGARAQRDLIVQRNLLVRSSGGPAQVIQLPFFDASAEFF